MIDERDMTEVAVDTTVMEKAIIYPTDGKLYLKSLLRLNKQVGHTASYCGRVTPVPGRSWRSVSGVLPMPANTGGCARRSNS